jgi:tRNA threonylcarbamoyladenosine biosynthesis protein TsaB
MRVLALETASYHGGAGIWTPDGLRFRGPFESRSASREILAATDELLSELGLRLEDLDLVAASTGPGLFTGVRVGLSIAKTLVWSVRAATGSDRPALVGVPTLDAVAACAADSPSGAASAPFIVAAGDARRGEIYAALFRASEGAGSEPERLGVDIVAKPEHVMERLGAAIHAPILSDCAVHFIGDGAQRYRELLSEIHPRATGFERPEPALLLEKIAELGIARMAGQALAHPMELKPHYVRRPDARPSVVLFEPTAK